MYRFSKTQQEGFVIKINNKTMITERRRESKNNDKDDPFSFVIITKFSWFTAFYHFLRLFSIDRHLQRHSLHDNSDQNDDNNNAKGWPKAINSTGKCCRNNHTSASSLTLLYCLSIDKQRNKFKSQIQRNLLGINEGKRSQQRHTSTEGFQDLCQCKQRSLQDTVSTSILTLSFEENAVVLELSCRVCDKSTGQLKWTTVDDNRRTQFCIDFSDLRLVEGNGENKTSNASSSPFSLRLQYSWQPLKIESMVSSSYSSARLRKLKRKWKEIKQKNTLSFWGQFHWVVFLNLNHFFSVFRDSRTQDFQVLSLQTCGSIVRFRRKWKMPVYMPMKGTDGSREQHLRTNVKETSCSFGHKSSMPSWQMKWSNLLTTTAEASLRLSQSYSKTEPFRFWSNHGMMVVIKAIRDGPVDQVQENINREEEVEVQWPLLEEKCLRMTDHSKDRSPRRTVRKNAQHLQKR